MTTTPLNRRQRKKETRARLGLSHFHPRDRRCLVCKPLPKSAATADPDYIPPPQAAPAFAPSRITTEQVQQINAQASAGQQEAQRKISHRRGLARVRRRQGSK